VEWGLDTVQDADMLTRGFFVNTKWKLAICTTCSSGVGADTLYSHLNKHLKSLGLQATRGYCKSVIEKYHLLSRPRIQLPTTIVPAVYGLPIKSNMYHCSGCGYAAQTTSSIRFHRQTQGCQGSAVLGLAQTFFPKAHIHFFAVTVPPAKASEPDGPVPVSVLFKAQFAPRPISDPLITIPSNTRDMNHFLSLGNWFQEVNGLTGKEVQYITRNSLSRLRPLVRKSVNLYVETKNGELREEDPAVKVSMGDYNERVLLPHVVLGPLLMPWFPVLGGLAAG
jgi:hypothetical protein